MRTSITFVSSITDARDTIARVRPVPLCTQLRLAASPARLLLSLRLRAFSWFSIWADVFFFLAATQVTTKLHYKLQHGCRFEVVRYKQLIDWWNGTVWVSLWFGCICRFALFIDTVIWYFTAVVCSKLFNKIRCVRKARELRTNRNSCWVHTQTHAHKETSSTPSTQHESFDTSFLACVLFLVENVELCLWLRISFK